MKRASQAMKVITNADDLGLSSEVNEMAAVFMDRGLVTSGSIMANGPAVAGAVKLATRFPQVSFGIHLNVTDFGPVSPPEKVLPLLTPEGKFNRLNTTEIRNERRILRALYEEWSQQLAALRGMGISISHLDSHHNVHSRFCTLPVLRRIVAETGIERVRNIQNIFPPETPSHFAGRVRRRAWSLGLLHYVRAAAPSHLCHVREFYDHVERRTARGDRLRNRAEVVELMVHFGNERYADEIDILDSGWLEQNGFVLTDYRKM